MVNAQEWLDNNYNQIRKNLVNVLNIRERVENLGGSLVISCFSKIKKIDCSENQLTRLTVNCCQKLEKIDCSNNRITKLVLSDLINLVELDYN